jgi:hypothetical protein
MKSWNIEIFLLDEAGQEKPAACFTKATYNLHPSFANPVQSTYSEGYDQVEIAAANEVTPRFERKRECVRMLADRFL